MGRKPFIKKFLPRTLFGRSLLILITPVLLTQIITTFVFFDRHWSKMTTRLAYAVSGEIAVITETVKDNPKKSAALVARNSGRYLDLDVQYDAGRDLPEETESSVIEVWEAVVAQKLSDELRAQIDESFVIHTNLDEKMIDVFIRLEDGVLTVRLPQRRLFSSSGYVFLLWMFGTSLLLLLIAILFMRNQIRPIRKLAVAADRFGKGRDTPFFKPEGATEVRQAGHAFLDMRRRIQRQISQRTEMLAGVSHDLRTPLTRMKLQIEMMPDSADKDGMKADVQHMQSMIQGYLDFVRGDGDEEFEAVYLKDVVDRVNSRIVQKNITLETDIDPRVHLQVRPLAFERALSNLVNNAAKYAQTIWVKAYEDGEKVQIQIEDNGPGIHPDFYDEVFKPFTRVDISRNTDTGGVGLGLPIAMDIVHSHGGKIWLSASEHGGLCVTLRMPV